jgi:hypothetical protein
MTVNLNNEEMEHYTYNASTKNEMYLIESETLVTSSTPRTVTHKTDCHDITEMLLKVALNTIPNLS